jgi:hypothetical protein
MRPVIDYPRVFTKERVKKGAITAQELLDDIRDRDLFGECPYGEHPTGLLESKTFRWAVNRARKERGA